MVSIKGITLKKVKKFIGREGEGVTADVYIGNKKVGSYADYADGNIIPDIYIDNEYQNDFDTRIKQFFTEQTPMFKERDDTVRPVRLIEEGETWDEYYKRVSDVWEKYSVDSMGFFELLLLLIDYEKTFKKYAKQGYKHFVVVKDTVVNNYTAVPIEFVSCSDGQALQEIIDRACNDERFIRPKAYVYSSEEDFQIK